VLLLCYFVSTTALISTVCFFSGLTGVNRTLSLSSVLLPFILHQ
jgi:hypothetical protein